MSVFVFYRCLHSVSCLLNIDAYSLRMLVCIPHTFLYNLDMLEYMNGHCILSYVPYMRQCIDGMPECNLGMFVRTAYLKLSWYRLIYSCLNQGCMHIMNRYTFEYILYKRRHVLPYNPLFLVCYITIYGMHILKNKIRVLLRLAVELLLFYLLFFFKNIFSLMHCQAGETPLVRAPVGGTQRL